MPVFRHDGELHYFAHVPKCGGSSVENMLIERFGALALLNRSHYETPRPRRWSRSSPQHITWPELCLLFPEGWIASVFTVVRHPLTRVVSAYHDATRLGTIPQLLGIEAWFDRSVARMECQISVHDRHLRPLVEFFPADATVFRLEDGLGAVSEWLDTRFGVSGSGALPHELKTAHLLDRHVTYRAQTAVSRALRDRVADYYAEDFRRFGYDPDDPATADIRVYGPRDDAIPFREHVRLAGNRVLSGAGISLARLEPRVRGLGRRFNAEL